MRQKSRLPGPTQNATPASPSASERLVRDIRRVTRKHYSAEDKIRIVLDGLCGEVTIAELCRREGIAESLYYSWSKECGLEIAGQVWVFEQNAVLQGLMPALDLPWVCG